MSNAIFPKRSMNTRIDSPFFYFVLFNAKEVRWCGLLVANCVSNWDVKVSKQSMECGGA